MKNVQESKNKKDFFNSYEYVSKRGNTIPLIRVLESINRHPENQNIERFKINCVDRYAVCSTEEVFFKPDGYFKYDSHTGKTTYTNPDYCEEIVNPFEIKVSGYDIESQTVYRLPF